MIVEHPFDGGVVAVFMENAMVGRYGGPELH